MRKFQIRETDKSGNGSFYYFDAPDSASIDEVGEIAEQKANEDVLSRHQKRLDRLRYSIFPISPPRLKQTLQVVELVGKTYIGELRKMDGTIEKREMNDCKVKRGGMKLSLQLKFAEFTFADGSKKKFEGYKYKK